MNDVNNRVGVIIDATEKVVRFLGYGTYVGQELLDVDESEICGDAFALVDGGIAVGKIELDSGQIMYECEAHVESQEQVEGQLKEYIRMGYDVIQTDIYTLRNES
jgi:hypothetical protein